MVVTGAAHRDAVAAQLPDLDVDSIVAEPSARDSMAAIGLAAAMLERRDPDAVMGSFAADHVITESGVFRETVRLAVEVARDDWLVTIGIDPISPSPAFGYVHLGRELDRAPGRVPGAGLRGEAVGAHGPRVPRERAVPLERRHVRGAADRAAGPARGVRRRPSPPRCATSRRTPPGSTSCGRRCPGSRSTTRSPSPRPTPAGWRSCPRRSAGTTSATSTRSRSCSAPRRTAPSRSCWARRTRCGSCTAPGSSCRAPAGWSRSIGIDDVVVVDTPDALLVTTRSRAQEVKRIVAALKETAEAT